MLVFLFLAGRREGGYNHGQESRFLVHPQFFHKLGKRPSVSGRNTTPKGTRVHRVHNGVIVPRRQRIVPLATVCGGRQVTRLSLLGLTKPDDV